MNVHTKEHGRFYTDPNGNVRFLGSASGVYLVDTIGNELSKTSRDDVFGPFMSRIDGLNPIPPGSTSYSVYLLTKEDFSDTSRLRDVFNNYFTTWHPLFPFLDGKKIRELFENAIQNSKPEARSTPFAGLREEDGLTTTAIFRAIFTIGSLGRDPNGGAISVIPVFDTVLLATTMAHTIVTACESAHIDDISAIQALLAIEVALYISRKFRHASHLSGTVLKLLLETGLHRCPCRYPSSFHSDEERELRKRIFYSAYVLDRLLSMEFGFPVILRDSDIDVCLPGAEEIHGRQERTSKRKRDESFAVVHPSNPVSPPPALDPSFSRSDFGITRRLLPAYTIASAARLMGRTMSVFNQSRRWRTADSDEALRVRTDLDEWWNDLDLSTQDNSRYATLFKCMYNLQIININRHSLSLPPESIHHRHALQSVTLAARTICSTLGVDDIGFPWPGYGDMLFTSVLVLMYAVQLGSKATSDRVLLDLRNAYKTLNALEKLWETIKPMTKLVETFIFRLDPTISQVMTTPTDWLEPDGRFQLGANPLEFFFPGPSPGPLSGNGSGNGSGMGNGISGLETLNAGNDTGLLQMLNSFQSGQWTPTYSGP